MMVADASGEAVGSLSGGCVEDDFLARLVDGEFQSPAVVVGYGDPRDDARGARVELPCGGRLQVLVERMPVDEQCLDHLNRVKSSLARGPELFRRVDLTDGTVDLEDANQPGSRVLWEEGEEQVRIRIGPVARLILAGYSSVADACARFALGLGYQVVLCDPRNDITANLQLPDGVRFEPVLPSLYIAADGACTASTAVIAATHDPRIDDLAIMAAVKTPASYIGAMGSRKTSHARAERLRRSGGLSSDEIDRIHMPIGLQLGSKTPAEIALAIMADVVRVRRGRSLDDL